MVNLQDWLLFMRTISAYRSKLFATASDVAASSTAAASSDVDSATADSAATDSAATNSAATDSAAVGSVTANFSAADFDESAAEYAAVTRLLESFSPCTDFNDLFGEVHLIEGYSRWNPHSFEDKETLRSIGKHNKSLFESYVLVSARASQVRAFAHEEGRENGRRCEGKERGGRVKGEE